MIEQSIKGNILTVICTSNHVVWIGCMNVQTNFERRGLRAEVMFFVIIRLFYLYT